MTQQTPPTNTAKTSRLQIILALSGLFYTLSGLALLFLPTWFFTYIGDFPPFNRHYMGDAGAFILPLGIGLLTSKVVCCIYPGD